MLNVKGAAQTNNGNIILVGYSGTNTKGKRDAWMLCVDQNGKALWQQKFGAAGDDEFQDVVYHSPTNTLTTIGFKNEKKHHHLRINCWDSCFRTYAICNYYY